MDEVIQDMGSRLLDRVTNSEGRKIYVTEKDRWTRFGFDSFLSFAWRFGADMVVVKNESLSPGKEHDSRFDLYPSCSFLPGLWS